MFFVIARLLRLSTWYEERNSCCVIVYSLFSLRHPGSFKSTTIPEEEPCTIPGI